MRTLCGPRKTLCPTYSLFQALGSWEGKKRESERKKLGRTKARKEVLPRFFLARFHWSPTTWNRLPPPGSASLSHAGFIIPSLKFTGNHLNTSGEREALWSKLSYPRTQHNVPGQGLTLDNLIWRRL